MGIEQVYITHIHALLSTFKMCNIYSYELIEFDKKIANSSNKGNIYSALDTPDFKIMRQSKLKTLIIKLVCDRIGLGKNIAFSMSVGFKFITIDGEKFQLYFFPFGTIPEINLQNEKSIFFMHKTDFKTIFYCGKLDLTGSLNEISINKFYETNCINGTTRFFAFNLLTQ